MKFPLFSLFRQGASDVGFSFFMDSKPSGVVVGRNGEGLREVWRDQLREFRGVSLDVSNAIVAAYPSPLQLKLASNHYIAWIYFPEC